MGKIVKIPKEAEAFIGENVIRLTGDYSKDERLISEEVARLASLSRGFMETAHHIASEQSKIIRKMESLNWIARWAATGYKEAVIEDEPVRIPDPRFKPFR